MGDAGDEVGDVARAVQGGHGLAVGVGAGFAGCVVALFLCDGLAEGFVIGLDAVVDGSGACAADGEWRWIGSPAAEMDSGWQSGELRILLRLSNSFVFDDFDGIAAPLSFLGYGTNMRFLLIITGKGGRRFLGWGFPFWEWKSREQGIENRGQFSSVVDSAVVVPTYSAKCAEKMGHPGFVVVQAVQRNGGPSAYPKSLLTSTNKASNLASVSASNVAGGSLANLDATR